ncbi:4Fe-4S dicluster domain-containing protein [bacterium]|nr:4Fe-4S dicluster domain-containing protein [bacterium]MBU1636934.1 4Fe-4S dicluster domain-containing protein [bacterium]MBU1920974.1 4Fe-4S dicluster domain-containing protein [bacterium]
MEQLILSLLIVVSLYLFIVPVRKRLAIVSTGKKDAALDRIGERWVRFFKEVVFQSKVIKERPIPGLMHTLVFWGFCAFALETFHHFATAYGWHPLGEGAFHRIYGGFVALFAVLTSVGIIVLAFRRFVLRPEALGKKLSWSSGLVAVYIVILMVTYLLSYFNLLESPVAQKMNWWLHALVILAFLILIPHSKHLHLVLGPLTTFRKDFELARIYPLDFEKDEMGVEKLTDFSAHTMLGAFTCVECGRCYDNCPANKTGKALDPKQLMLDLRAGLLSKTEEPVVGNVIEEEILWQCVTCGACTYQCPVGIDQVIPIIEMRRGQVSGGEFPSTMRPLFDNLERSGNPWKYPQSEASDFIAENKLPIFNGHEVLFWLGCMGRYDFYYRKVALSMVKILDAAGVSWGILKNEKCTGDAARRAGNELVFQMLAEENIESLNQAAPKVILTTCPHCLRTLKEYRDLGLNKEIPIIHHSEFISQLQKNGKLKTTASAFSDVVYHDACYLSRYASSDHIRYPREVIRVAGASIKEPENHGERSFCCGAGGGLLFAEETAGERINHRRVKELMVTGAAEVGTACPFCHMMLRDGLKDLDQEAVPVKDIAEFIAQGLPDRTAAKSAGESNPGI